MRFALLLAFAACSSATAKTIAWSPPIEIAAGGGHKGPWQQNDSQFDYVDDPSVALAADGAAVVVWVDHRRKDVLLQIYERDGRARFAAPVEVSRTRAVFSWLPRIAVRGRDVHVLWQEIVFSGGTHGGEIFYARSRDGGATFGESVNLSRSQNGDGKGRIDKTRWHNGSLDLALAGDGLYAAWTEYDGALWFARAPDGETFAAPLRIAGTEALPARAPAIAVGRDAIYLAWSVGEDAGADLRIARSTDRGATFTEPQIVERSPGFSDAPKLAVDPAGTLHLVYAESSGGPFDRYAIRYTRSRDGARTFEPTREIARGEQSHAYPSLDLDGGALHVVWETGDPARGLAIASSRDGGTTFTTPELVAHSRDPGGGDNGSHQGRLMRKLAARDGAIAVVNSALAYGSHSRVWLVRGQSAP